MEGFRSEHVEPLKILKKRHTMGCRTAFATLLEYNTIKTVQIKSRKVGRT